MSGWRAYDLLDELKAAKNPVCVKVLSDGCWLRLSHVLINLIKFLLGKDLYQYIECKQFCTNEKGEPKDVTIIINPQDSEYVAYGKIEIKFYNDEDMNFVMKIVNTTELVSEGSNGNWGLKKKLAAITGKVANVILHNLTAGVGKFVSLYGLGRPYVLLSSGLFAENPQSYLEYYLISPVDKFGFNPVKRLEVIRDIISNLKNYFTEYEELKTDDNIVQKEDRLRAEANKKMFEFDQEWLPLYEDLKSKINNENYLSETPISCFAAFFQLIEKTIKAKLHTKKNPIPRLSEESWHRILDQITLETQCVGKALEFGSEPVRSAFKIFVTVHPLPIQPIEVSLIYIPQYPKGNAQKKPALLLYINLDKLKGIAFPIFKVGNFTLPGSEHVLNLENMVKELTGCNDKGILYLYPYANTHPQNIYTQPQNIQDQVISVQGNVRLQLTKYIRYEKKLMHEKKQEVLEELDSYLEEYMRKHDQELERHAGD